MNGPRKFLLIVASILTFAPLMFSSATNVYITPNGGPQGSCTSNTQNPAWFNSPANWAAEPVKSVRGQRSTCAVLSAAERTRPQFSPRRVVALVGAR